MKINFDRIPDIFPAPVARNSVGEGRYFCKSCKKTMDEKQFFKTRRTEKFLTGLLPYCKTCITMSIVDNDPLSFLPVLKEIDAPYIPIEWRALLLKKDPKGPSIIGKYLSRMRLAQFKKYGWDDSQALIERDASALMDALRQETDTETEAENKAEEIIDMSDIKLEPPSEEKLKNSFQYGRPPEEDTIEIPQETLAELRASWGLEYNNDQYLALEKLYQDMQKAYIIQDPIAISNAKIICKMTIKMNKFLDIDDVESMTKISRQLDLFTKTANLAPVQQKDRQQATFSISEMAFLVEKKGGFVPKFDLTLANDKIDMILQDMKEYTQFLVRGESNIDELAEDAAAILAQEQLPEIIEDYDDFSLLESELLEEFLLEDEGEI